MTRLDRCGDVTESDRSLLLSDDRGDRFGETEFMAGVEPGLSDGMWLGLCAAEARKVDFKLFILCCM